jgi:hypothetical protein
MIITFSKMEKEFPPSDSVRCNGERSEEGRHRDGKL